MKIDLVFIEIRITWVGQSRNWQWLLKNKKIEKIEAIRMVWDEPGGGRMSLKEVRDIVQAFMTKEGIL